MISCESVSELNLTVGSEVAVLIKASQITVCQQPMPASDLTNQFNGKLTQVHNGEIYSELCIELDDQKSVSTIVANETLSSLNIRDNMALNISFFASSVILCCYN
jgi:molybdopterin-binding protein